MTARRRLVLVRHAKAEPFAVTDHDRDLTDHGRSEAHAAGSYLQERSVLPDHAVVSSAVRTRSTWEAMEQAMGSGAQVSYDAACYSGGAEVVLELLRYVPEEARVVLFVGHQPTVGHLAHLLDDGGADHEALHLMLQGFPTSSMAFFEVEGPWESLGSDAGRLVDFRRGDA
ncbi:MAG TPA: histidine phosphatase family protein [Nocardioidaceae bacterium]|nr:histidine phosphatase family protein [Nocardioidaceae bacterium]